MFKADIETKICLETMRYFWKKLQKGAAPVRTGIGGALTDSHCSHSKTHF